MSRLPIDSYWHFWDFPRNLRLSVKSHFFYLHSPFLEEDDEFVAYYQVFHFTGSHSKKDIEEMMLGRYYPPPHSVEYLGQIEIAALDFDQRRRHDIAEEPFRRFLTEHDYGFLYQDDGEAKRDQ